MKNSYHKLIKTPSPEHRNILCVLDLNPWTGNDEFPGAWWIARVNVPHRSRGEGIARQLLAECLLDADNEGVTLVLVPSESDGLTYEQLVAWYERHGFKWSSKPHESLMVREPNKCQVCKDLRDAAGIHNDVCPSW